MPLDFIMEAIMACVYLDKETYAAMLDGELRDYDVSILLESIRVAREKETAGRAAEKKRLRVLKTAETRHRNAVGDT